MTSATGVAAATPRNDLIDRALKGALAATGVPGLVAAVAGREGTLYEGAFGEADAGRPMHSDAIFRIASMTKPVTSVAAMQLIEEGRIGLEDNVRDHLPSFVELSRFARDEDANALAPLEGTVTVRHLLTHTSGLTANFTDPLIRDFQPRPGERPVGPFLFEPGERWHYGTSSDQLGYLVEAVSGQRLDDYVRKRIFEPLGMRDTFYDIPDEKQARLVPAHHREGGTIVKTPPSPPLERPHGGSGLAATAADYLRFTRMILNNGTLDGARILAPESVAAMGQNQIGPLGVPALRTAMPARSADFTFINDGRDAFGLGFLITAEHMDGKRTAGSLSWAGINNTWFWIDPARGKAAVILMQFLPFADTRALAVLDAFERAVYANA